MRIVFMGTPVFAARILFELAQQHELVAVYTRADAVRKRGKDLVPTPVKERAQQLGIPVFCPASLRDASEQERLRLLAPDCIVVAAYGMILPKEVLEIPQYGCINAHASLLPRWRGAAPIERAILAGDKQAGVCVMRMEEGLDTGDYCICRATDIAQKSAVELTEELADLAAAALLSALSGFEQGRLFWTPQNEDEVCYAEKIGKQELYITPSDTACSAERKVRCASEAHASKVCLAGKAVSLLQARLVSFEEAGLDQALPAGTLIYNAKRLYMVFSDACLLLLSVKPDGKKEMPAHAFVAGVQGLAKEPRVWEPLSE